VGRNLEAKLGADEQEPDRRPVRLGNPATDGESQTETRTGKSGGDKRKIIALPWEIWPVLRTLGGWTIRAGSAATLPSGSVSVAP